MQRIAIFAIMTLAALTAHGQILKCTDPQTGRVTFSDNPCATGQHGVEVAPRLTPEQIQADRDRANAAHERRSRERAEEQQRAAELAATTPAAPAPQWQAPNAAHSNDCRQAQRDLETIASSITGSEEHRRNRINAATVRVNAACGMQTELIQPPPQIVVAPPRHQAFPPPFVRPLPQPIPQGPRPITGCDGASCRDAQGGVYRRSSPTTLTGPDGAACHRSGAQWVCN